LPSFEQQTWNVPIVVDDVDSLLRVIFCGGFLAMLSPLRQNMAAWPGHRISVIFCVMTHERLFG
jgi:hypothetical protein